MKITRVICRQNVGFKKEDGNTEYRTQFEVGLREVQRIELHDGALWVHGSRDDSVTMVPLSTSEYAFADPRPSKAEPKRAA